MGYLLYRTIFWYCDFIMVIIKTFWLPIIYAWFMHSFYPFSAKFHPSCTLQPTKKSSVLFYNMFFAWVCLFWTWKRGS
jgi:hypothetical protein